MAEYNKQRFYWIKLTDRFMTSDTVDFLMEQKDGANYVVLYQMLCLKTINQNGELARTLGEIIVPYNAEKIQRDTKWFSIDTIRVALELYKKLGLIYEQENGVLRITDFDNMIGSQTISAYKKQEQISKRGGKKVEKIPPDKDIDKEEEKEKKDIYKYISKKEKESFVVDLDETYNKLLNFCREDCKVLYDRYQKKINNGNLNGAREVMDMLEEITETYTDEQLRALFRKANGMYWVQPKYQSIDFAYMLNHLNELQLQTNCEQTKFEEEKVNHYGNERQYTEEDYKKLFTDIDDIIF